MVLALPQEEFGPDVAYREHSLLDNPRAEIADGDILTVHVCQVRTGCPCDQALVILVCTGFSCTDKCLSGGPVPALECSRGRVDRSAGCQMLLLLRAAWWLWRLIWSMRPWSLSWQRTALRACSG